MGGQACAREYGVRAAACRTLAHLGGAEANRVGVVEEAALGGPEAGREGVALDGASVPHRDAVHTHESGTEQVQATSSTHPMERRVNGATTDSVSEGSGNTTRALAAATGGGGGPAPGNSRPAPSAASAAAGASSSDDSSSESLMRRDLRRLREETREGSGAAVAWGKRQKAARSSALRAPALRKPGTHRLGRAAAGLALRQRRGLVLARHPA